MLFRLCSGHPDLGTTKRNNGEKLQMHMVTLKGLQVFLVSEDAWLTFQRKMVSEEAFCSF